MASVTVFTSTVPTSTVYATSTILSEDERTRRSRIRSTGTVTLVVLTTDADGDEVAETSEVETVVTSTSTIISTSTSTIVTSVPVETLFSTSLSTSTLPTTTSSTSTSSTTSLSPVRSRSTSSSSSSDEVVVVIQFTTITPIATPSTSAPVLSASSSTGPFGPVVSSNANARTAGMSGDESSANTSSSRSALSTGAIAGIAVGAVAVAVILGILGFMFCCRRRNGRRDSMYATTGGRSDERLAASVFNPGYQSPPPMRSYSSSGRQMANIGAAEASVIAVAGAGAAAGNRNSRRSSKDPGYAGVGAGRRTSTGNGNSAPTAGRNKPVPDVPPPVSNLTFARPSLAQRQSSDESDMSSKSPYSYSQNQRQSHTYGNQAPSRSYRLSDGAGPAYAPVPTRTPPQNRQGNRISAPVGNSLAPPGPQLGQEERAAALKRAKSAASIASIPTEKLGKGAGYASPMPPMDPLGKPMDQKTWRERQKLVKSGEFLPDKHLTEEQKMRRDSQLAKLQAAQAGTASAKPGLSNLQEQDELALSRSRSPQRISQMPMLAPTPVAPAPAPQSTLPSRPISAPGTSNRDSASLPYINPSSPAPTYATRNPFADAAPRSPPPNTSIYPSLPPSSPHRNVAQGAPSSQPSYQIYQPPQPEAYHPIRASFGTSVGQQNQGPPPAPSGSKNESRLPSIPGSRPTSMALPSSPAVPDNLRRHSNANQGTNADSPYTPAAANAQSAGGFFQQANRSSNSFSPHRGVPSTSIADDVYGGLTSGLSDRDILRLSMSQQQQSQRGKK